MILTQFDNKILEITEIDKGYTYDNICDRYCITKNLKRCPSKKIEESLNKLIVDGFLKLFKGKFYKISMYIGEGNYPVRVTLIKK